MELDFGKIEQYSKAYKKWLKQIPSGYDYDNCQCCCFAHLLSNAAEKEGYQTYKVCALLSEREGNKKGVSAYLPLADGSGFSEVKWDYHMAFALEVPVYKDSPKTEFLVADPVLFGDQLVTLKQWKQTLSCPDYAFIMARKGMSLQGSPRGYWLSGDEPKDLDAHAMGELSALENRVKKQELLSEAVKTNPQLKKTFEKNRMEHYAPLKSMLRRGLKLARPMKKQPIAHQERGGGRHG